MGFVMYFQSNFSYKHKASVLLITIALRFFGIYPVLLT